MSPHLIAAVTVSAFLVGVPAGWWLMARFGRKWVERYYLWQSRRR